VAVKDGITDNHMFFILTNMARSATSTWLIVQTSGFGCRTSWYFEICNVYFL